MMFVNSLKLFGSNWGKVLKFFLYYIVVWGICISLFLPVFFEFKNLIVSGFQSAEALESFTGVFQGSIGMNLNNLLHISFETLITAFNTNLGIAIYGIVVIFVVLPFLVNLGKYTLNEMMYSYMTSNAKIGFLSAMVKSLRRSVTFSISRTFYNFIFLTLTLAGVYGLSLISDTFFVSYILPVVLFALLVVMFTANQILVLGWTPASIVFDCNVFSAYRKGTKAVKRHFWTIFGMTMLYYVLFWALVMIFGVYTLVVLVPLMTALICVYNMVVFFASQGMRFYVNDKNILTPKKLEEVDNIKKTAYIL